MTDDMTLGDHVNRNEIFKAVCLWFMLNLAGVEVSLTEADLLVCEKLA